MGEQFTPAEEMLLKRFVTSVDSDVFCLINLPEVIKGALFSRYSRTTKSLRRLLIDEFINNPDLGLSHAKAEAGTDALAVQKAEGFYERILDGYGDDSVGELGGVHIALESISNIATKFVQDSRIGGSPLEKSSRYVWFNKKVGGEYQFCKEPTLIATTYGKDYVAVNQLLFETYDELIEPMQEYFRERVPQDKETPDQAYNFSIRARACDALRGLLPASTLTNMGVFGNGRFFEYLLIKLRASGLAELQDLADKMQRELEKVIPSFVRRAKPDHRHFSPAAAFLKTQRDTMVTWANQHTKPEPVTTGPTVTLVDYDKDGEEKVLATLLYAASDTSLQTLRTVAKHLSPKDRAAIIADAIGLRSNRRHKPPRAFENAYYTFEITTDFGAYRDLHRHRILTQERQLLTTMHGYDVPHEIVDAGFADKWHACMHAADKTYKNIVKTHPYEAQYVVPFAYNVRWYVTANARSLYWLCELRATPQGHPAYRLVAQRMFSAINNVHPLLFSHAVVDMNDYALGRLQAETKLAQKKTKEDA